MEIFRKLAVPGRPTSWVPGLLAAVVALPMVGFAQEPTVSVDAPRAQIQTPPSPLSVLPDPAQAAAFRISPASLPIAGQPQPMPPGTSPPDATSSAGPPSSTATPINYGTWQPPATTGPSYPRLPAPAVAPAWRWHGYGAVVPTETPQPAAPASSASPQKPGADDSRSPTASDLGPPVPAFAAPTDPVPPSLPAVGSPTPFGSAAAEPAWRSGVQRVEYVQANPMTAGPAPWLAAPPAPVTALASTNEWCGPTVMLDAPRPAGTYISRAVSDAAVQPVSYRSPPAPSQPRPTAVLPAVQTSIERACAGRVRDVEIVTRGPANLLVRLKVRQAADAEYVANAIARLPELGPYQVLFEMQVVR